MNTSSANSSSVDHFNAQDANITIYTVNFILSVPTNGYVLWLIVTGAGGTMTTDFFTLNLTVSEILFCLSSVFLVIGEHIRTDLIHFGKSGFGFLYTGRPLFQSCICVERYLAVVHPVTFLTFKPLRYRVMCCSAAWLIILGDCLFELCQVDVSLDNYVYMSLYLIMLSVILFCCVSVLWALKQPGPGEGGREREGPNNIKMRAFKIILVILVSMVTCYLPLIVLLPVSDDVNIYSILLFNVVISGFVQPLLFLHRAGKLPFIRGL